MLFAHPRLPTARDVQQARLIGLDASGTHGSQQCCHSHRRSGQDVDAFYPFEQLFRGRSLTVGYSDDLSPGPVECILYPTREAVRRTAVEKDLVEDPSGHLCGYEPPTRAWYKGAQGMFWAR